MRSSLMLLLASFLAFAVTACDQTRGAAATSALPATPTAVGPVPGVGGVQNPSASPYANDAVAVQQGRQLFVRMNCSGCHGGRAGGGMGPSLRDVDWIYGSRDDQIFDSIAEGRAHGMPAWGTRLPADQIWRIVAYIKSMRTPQEPDKPESFP